MSRSDEDKFRIGPYTVEERIGSGGMGEVFRAYDSRLDRWVALKQIRPERADLPKMQERFIREARSAARLSHPSIVQVFDIIETDEWTWIVMELVEGRRLADLTAGGNLSVSQVVLLGLEIADGLEAAHAQGIVHRDLKTQNVIVTDTGRAKILDFGLAKHLDESETDTSLSTDGEIVGTPRSMSPEQVMGQPVDHRSDLFSLGTLLYEMVTGESPFVAQSPFQTVARICTFSPPSVGLVKPETPAELAGLIERLLAKDPELRPSTVSEVIEVLRGLAEAYGSSSGGHRIVAQGSSSTWARGGRRSGGFPTEIWPQEKRPRIPRMALAGIGLVIAVLAGAVGWRALEPTEAVRQSVAVLGFKNLSQRAEFDWMSTGIAEMLNAELAIGQQLRMIAGENVAEAKLELGLRETPNLAPETLSKLRAILGADLIILGAYVVAPEPSDEVRLMLKVEDAERGETIATLLETGSQAEILPLLSKVGERLRVRLGVSGSEGVVASGARPATPDALRHYSEGLALLRSQEFMAARQSFERALEADSEFPLTYAALAESWSALGYDVKAQEQAARAVELAESLPRADRLFVQARDFEMSRDWPNAIASYRTLYEFFPDSVDYGLRLVNAMAQGGEAAAALEIVESLRDLPTPASSDARIWLAEAEVAKVLADHQRQLEAALGALRIGQAQEARLVVARARLLETDVRLRIGKPREAASAAEHARKIYVDLGDTFGEASALHRIGMISYGEGDYPEARKIFTGALERMRRVGSQRGIASQLTCVAICDMRMGALAVGRRFLDDSLVVAEQIGDLTVSGLTRINLGLLLLRQGQIAAALESTDLGLAESDEVGWSYAVHAGLYVLGEIRLASGDLGAARDAFSKGLDLSRVSSEPHLTGYLLSGVGKLELARGNFGAAREQHLEALKLREELWNEAEAADSRLSVALLDLEEGRFEQAKEQLESSLPSFRRLKIRSSEVLAIAGLAAIAEQQDEEEAAAEEISKAEAVLPEAEVVASRLRARILLARTLANLGQAKRAKIMLGSVFEERSLSGPFLQLEAGLLLAEIERGGGSSRGRLDAIREEAAQRGFANLEAKAAAALRSDNPI